MKQPLGFTLLEMLLSVAAITVIAGISIPVYQSFQARNELDIAAVTVAQSLRRAQLLAQAGDGDSNTGVRVQSGGITVFHGASYALRDTAVDEDFSVPTSIVPSGVSEIVFTKFTGLPTSVGSFILNSSTGETRTITINAKGSVAY